MIVGKQAVFDHIATHLLTQKKKALLDKAQQRRFDIKCAYRTPAGLTCAIGCLIPEQDYKAEYEGKNLGNLKLERFIELEDDSWLLEELQFIHDSFKPSLWRTKLKKLASKHGLVWSH